MLCRSSWPIARKSAAAVRALALIRRVIDQQHGKVDTNCMGKASRGVA